VDREIIANTSTKETSLWMRFFDGYGYNLSIMEYADEPSDKRLCGQHSDRAPTSVLPNSGSLFIFRMPLDTTLE